MAIESESSSGAANVGKVTEHVGEENTGGAGAAVVDNDVSVRSEWSPSCGWCRFDLNLE